MTNRVAILFGVAALATQLVMVAGCSSSGGAAATGGTTGSSGGAAGGSTGAGGSTAAAAKTGDVCGSGVKNKGPCTTEPVCWNTCGPNKSGYKNCTCAGGQWACPTCAYEPGGDFTCYKITAATTACPADPSDPVGGLPASGSPCTQDPCKPCGSGSNLAYRDSTGMQKIGWCICITSPDGASKTYSCASVNEWPM